MTPPRTRQHPRLRAALAAAVPFLLAVPLAACERVVSVDVALVTTTCDADPALRPLAGATDLQVRVYGEGVDTLALSGTVSPGDGRLEIPAIPPGRGRVVVVEALANPGGVVVARGESAPLDLSGVVDRVPVTIFLRRVSAFTSTARKDTPGTCSALAEDRAAHAMALLEDGRVLVAGGLRFVAVGAGVSVRYLNSTEIYDPLTGTFTPGPPLQIGRAYHTATHLPGTPYTVVAGGESVIVSNGQSIVQAVKPVEIFDETSNSFIGLAELVQARSRHAAAVADGGRLVLVGGYDTAGVPLASTEVFDPDTKGFHRGPALPAARADAALVAAPGGDLFVVGGWDGANLVRRAELLVGRGNGDYDVAPGIDLTLATGRASPLAAFADGRIVVTGGFATADRTVPPFESALASTELVWTSERRVAATQATLRARRGYGIIAGLRNGDVLVAGGAETPDGGAQRILDTADVLFADRAGTLVARQTNTTMRAPRERARAVVLADGTVLVTGGVTAARETVATAEVFQPEYKSTLTDPYR